MNKVKVHRRPDLWHGRYDQSIRFWLREASCLRELDHGRVRKIIQRRRDWGQRMVSTVSSPKQPGTWRWQSLEITEQDEQNVLSMLEFLLAEKREYRKSIMGDWMYFYTSDPTLINDIENLPWLDQRRMHKSRIDLIGNPGTVVLENPRYRHRTYFRGYLRLTEQQETSLRQYLTALDHVRLSPALVQWTQGGPHKHYIGDYFFIDHDDMGLITMLSLMIPRIIRRTKPIEAAK